ncbi:MAG: class I SAM-dependent methyltransferase [Betaproteobacteria bacterium]
MFNVANSKSHNLLVEWIVQSALAKKGKQYLRGRLIDIGCGTKPYESLLKGMVSEHVGVDHEATFHDQANIDLYGTAYAIPAADDSFDSALCTAVLEHLEEPETAIRECYRVLKPGGAAIYCVPFIWHLHEEPRDFYRYSKYGLRYLFEKANFEIVEMIALSGFWVTFGQLLVYKLLPFNRGPLRWFKIFDGVVLLIQAIAFGLDRVDKAEQWTWMYLVVARKPITV